MVRSGIRPIRPRTAATTGLSWRTRIGSEISDRYGHRAVGWYSRRSGRHGGAVVEGAELGEGAVKVVEIVVKVKHCHVNFG